jgi:hypothetical protein
MTAELVNLRTIQFSEKFSLLSQTMGGKMNPYVLSGQHTGKMASPTNQIAPTAMQRVTDRFTPLTPIHATVARRWVMPDAFEHPQLVDKFDELQTLGDPKPGLVENAVMAAARVDDQTLLQAFFADAKTGETAGTTVSFGTTTTATTGQNVAVAHGAAAATKLTVAKLREVMRTFMRNKVDVDREQIWGALDADNHDSLLAETQATSLDYQTKPVLEDGKITRFMGINFLRIQEVKDYCTGTDDASGTSVGLPFWVPSGMYRGIWQETNTNITQRTDLTLQPWQVYLSKMVGATRLDEAKVVRVWCR